MRSIIGIGLLGTVLLTGCVFLDDSFHKKELTSVEVTARDNPGLDQDYRAYRTSTNTTATLYLPNKVDLASLMARVDFQGIRADIDGVPVSPNGNRLDFSSPRTLTITGPDDQTANYQLVAEYQRLVFQGFFFYRADNPSLPSWFASCTIDTDGSYQWLWDGTHGVSIPTQPTTSIQYIVPDSIPPTLIPRFGHNAVRVEYRGAELVSGVTPIDTTTDQVVTLVGADGTRQPVDLKFTYPALTLYSVGVLLADNPSMHRDSFASINNTTKTIDLPVPTNAEATGLVLQINHTGTSLLMDGVALTSRLTPVDLTHDRTLTILGRNSLTKNYTLHPSAVAPSSAKELNTWATYTSKSKLVPYQPDPYYDGRSYTTTAGGVDQLTLTGSAWNTNRAAVYLALTTSGWKVTVAGKVLTQGPLSTETYNPNNFVDFTNPVQLVITAEDLSTRTITLTMVLQ